VIFGEQGIVVDEKLVIAISQGLPPFSARAGEEAEALLHQRCSLLRTLDHPIARGGSARAWSCDLCMGESVLD